MTNTETKQRRQPPPAQPDDQDSDLNGESIGRTNQPVHEVRLGRIVAAIWAHETEYGPRHNVTVCRIYKDGEQWKRSDSFGRDDLPLLCKAADRAHDWILEQGRARATIEGAA